MDPLVGVHRSPDPEIRPVQGAVLEAVVEEERVVAEPSAIVEQDLLGVRKRAVQLLADLLVELALLVQIRVTPDLLAFGRWRQGQHPLHRSSGSTPSIFLFNVSILKSTNSILFWNDVIIENLTYLDQRNIKICCAFNGWLYATYSSYYNSTTTHDVTIHILSSKNNGLTWYLKRDIFYGTKNLTNALDIIICGNDSANLQVILGYSVSNTITGSGLTKVYSFNSEVGTIFWQYTVEQSTAATDLKLCSDYSFPAVNSNPYSIGVLYSTNPGPDSLIFKSSILS